MEAIEKLPLGLFLAIYLGVLGMQYYNFENDPSSAFAQKKNQLEAAKNERTALQGKLQQATDFFRSLEAKKVEIQSLARQLAEMKSVVSENLDVPGFMKSVVTESSRVGIKVVSIRPTQLKKTEYYAEQAFDLSFRGVYAQLVVFLDRLSGMQNIVRVDNFNIKRDGSAVAPYVEIEGVVQLKTYRYLGTKADEVAKGSSATTIPTPPALTPASPASPATTPPASAPQAGGGSQ